MSDKYQLQAKRLWSVTVTMLPDGMDLAQAVINAVAAALREAGEQLAAKDAEKRGMERAITIARNLKYSGDFETNYPTQYKKFMESRDNIYDLADALIEIIRAEIEKKP